MSIQDTSSPMVYQEHLGLTHNPFPVIPDADNFYQSPSIDTLVTEVQHAILSRKGFLIIAGEIGLGKTTISRRLLKTLEEHQVTAALVFHTFFQGLELLRAINRDFGITGDRSGMEAEITALNSFLLDQNRDGINCAIIIDDAQNLSLESLELIRLISNLETNSEKLVQILLIGQPELAAKLDSHALRQLKSRIVIHATVEPFNLDELKQYIFFKLNSAGGNGCLDLPERSFRLLHKLTGGNPRRVNILMDRCLYGACAHATQVISPTLIREAVRDLNLTPPPLRHRLPTWITAPILAATMAATVVIVTGVPPLTSIFTPPVPPPKAMSITAGSSKNHNSGENPATAAANKGTEIEASPVGTVVTARGPVHGAAAPGGAEVPTEIASFLALYGLEKYGPDFARAIAGGRIESLERLLASKTDFRLISLRQVPPRIKENYGLLRFADGNGGTSYLLLWKPRNWVETYHYQYRGDEIMALQRILKRLRLYNYAVDGIVGVRLMKGLAEFQRTQGLSPTGEPDLVTQFLLDQALPG